MAPEFSKGKTLVVLAIVIGCFAILWPKIFSPMFQASEVPTTIQQQQPPVKERDPSGALCCGVVFESDASSAAFLNELCSQVLKKRDGIPPDRSLSLCHHELMNKCGIDLEDVVKSDVDGAVVDRRLSSKFHGRVRAQNLTSCLEVNFGIDENLVRAKKSYHRPSDVLYPRHMRPERPPHLHPDMMHPALREKGRVIPPTRTIEKQAKPGPMPGMRPPMGGAPHIVSPSSPGSGGMGILMPIYTVGIIVFFLYTMMKIMFKKPVAEDETEPRIKDFHMDGEHRKYLFSEEYCTGVSGPVSEMTVKEYAILQEQQRQLLLQQQRRSRSRTPEIFARKDEELKTIPEDVCKKTEVASEESVNNLTEPAQVEEESEIEEVVEEVIIPRSPKMDTAGKPIGQWYLPPGFDGTGPAGSESADENETGSDIDLNDADERSLRLAFAALKAQKEEEVDQLRRRLEETERAMERICRQMGDVTDKLSTSAVADLLTPQLSSDKTNEELADESGQDECKPCQPDVAVEDFGLKSECAQEEEPKESVMISVVQSSEEKQDPVEEDFIEKSAAESESFLRSFVRRLPSERQPSEIIEEEVVIDESLPATSTSEVESPVPIEETAVEEKQTSEIEFVQEKQPCKQEEEAVEEITEIESEPTLEIECVQEQSATQEEETSVSYTEEPLKSEPVQELIKSDESSLQHTENLKPEVESVQESVQEEECQFPIEETVQQEIVSSEVESAPEKSLTQEEETIHVEETEPLHETISSKEEESRETVEEISETPAESVPVEEEEYQYKIKETVEEAPKFEVESISESSKEEESVSQVEETFEEEPIQESECVKEEPISEETISESFKVEGVQEQEEESQLQVEETVPEATVTEFESSSEKSAEQVEEIREPCRDDTQEEEISQLCTVETFESEPVITSEETLLGSSEVEAVQVQEEESQLQIEETIQEVIKTEVESTPEAAVVQEEEICEPIKEEECVSQIEETVEEQPAQESEYVEEESIPQEEEKSQPCIEETFVSEPEPVQESSRSEETILESSEAETVQVQEEEIQLQVEETIQEAAATKVESTPEAAVVQEEEICEPCTENTQQSEEEFVQDQVQEEECQLPVEKTIEEEPVCVQESIKVEESLIPIEETVEEPDQGKQEDESLAQSEGTLEETTQELTNSEEGESSLMDGETIEEILESEIESGHDLTVGEDEHTNIEDITEDTLEIETECVPQITDETAEEIPNKVEEVSAVEEILETQVESVQQVSDAVIEEIQPKLEEPDIQTACSKLKLEESGVKSVRQGSEERRMTVNVCGMELTACMEDCGKMPTDLLPKITEKPHAVKHEASDKIPSVFLDTTIPHDSHLVVSEAECSAEVVPPEELDLDENEYESSPVVLSGKMTLSVIGMELNAETPEIQEEPLYTVEEPDAPPRVRFSEPTDRIFLIPVDPEEELIPDDSHDEFHTEEDDEQVENPTVTYRPPTPPLQHLVDHEDAEFLTYDQLEEVGEVDSPTEETESEYQEEISVPLTPVPESLAEQSTEEANDVVSKESNLPEPPVGIDQSLIDSLESQIISAEESEALTENKNQVTGLADYVENVEVIPAVDEHASIGQMVEQIRVAMQESASKIVEEPLKVEDNKLSAEEEETAEPSEVISLDKEITTEEHAVSTKVPEQSRSVQNALNEMVDSIITESIPVAESLRRELDCDMLREDMAANLEQAEKVIHLLSERINDLSGAEKTVMEEEHQIVSDSNAETEDFERNREEEVMEHALEQIEVPVSSSQVEEQPEKVTAVDESVSYTEIESEPSISGFTIREDFPDDEDTQSMTEAEILQARQEIEEIKKLLADVSSGVVHHSASEVPTGSSNIVTELAYAMAEEAASAAAASKGSSPDMDEYEVIQTARPTESSEATHEMADSSVPTEAVKTTSTNNDS